MQNCTKLYKILQNFTNFHTNLQDSTRFYKILKYAVRTRLVNPARLQGLQVWSESYWKFDWTDSPKIFSLQLWHLTQLGVIKK